MKTILIAGTSIVNLALISYSIFIFYERKYKVISPKVLSFLTIGVVFDIIATICMIIGSSKGPFTMHGLIGYSSLAGMLIDLVIVWRQYIRNGNNSLFSPVVHKYSLFAYLWWIAAYVTGIVLVMLR